MKQLQNYPIIPVLVFDNIEQAKKVADIALENDCCALEVTLRTENALDIIASLNDSYKDDIILIAGTITNGTQAKQAKQAGATHFVSPGVSPDLLRDMQPDWQNWFGGISTFSEAMLLMEQGIHHAKFFPAGLLGGCKWLQAVQMVLPNMKFFPTGGVNTDNVLEYLGQSNVLHVGGTWLAASKLLHDNDYETIAQNFADVKALLKNR